MRILWGSFGLYVAIVLFPAFKRVIINMNSDHLFVRKEPFSDFGDDMVESFNNSAGWGALLLVVTILLCLTVGWHQARRQR